MRVRYKRSYPLPDAPSDLPARFLELCFEAKAGSPNDVGCRAWHGATRKRGDNGAEVGRMRIMTPSAST